MITASDILQLSYTPDLTEGGIRLALRSLSQGFDRSSGSVYAHLRKLVGGVAVELAFRRLLTSRGIPYEVAPALPFSAPDRYEVSLGGHRCTLKTALISRRNQISSLRRDPSTLLRSPAVLPEEELSAASLTGREVLLFAFLLGLTTNSPAEIDKAVETGQPIHLVHPLPVEWAYPSIWAPLGTLALKSECPAPLTVEIGGLDAERNFISETLVLPPLTRSLPANNYYSLAYIHVERQPGARLGLHSPNKNETHLVQPHEWDNIWVYGMEIWLAGYIPEQDFRRRASTAFTGSRVFQYSQTRNKNLTVPVSDLRPLENLFERVKNWESQKKSRPQ